MPFPGIDVNKADSAGLTVLMWAAQKSNVTVELVKILLAVPDIDVTARVATGHNKGRTVLGFARRHEVVEMLQAAGAPPMTTEDEDGAGRDINYYGIDDDIDELKFLLELWKGNGKVLNWVDKYDRTGLHYAVSSQRLECVRLLAATPGRLIQLLFRSTDFN